jgi:hypothetical protein
MIRRSTRGADDIASRRADFPDRGHANVPVGNCRRELLDCCPFRRFHRDARNPAGVCPGATPNVFGTIAPASNDEGIVRYHCHVTTGPRR